MRENEIEICTRPVEKILQGLPSEIRRVLVIRCAPEKLFNYCIEALQRWTPELELTVLCHQGGRVPGCKSIVYRDKGFFRLENLDIKALRRAEFDLVAVPYATNRRLSPYYHNVDRIAEAAGSGKILFVYQDLTAHLAEDDFMRFKQREVVGPYLKRKQEAIGEICEFTGEPFDVVEEKCDMAGIEATRLWVQTDPGTAEQVRRFYSGHDFYIYELMKTQYNGDREELVEAVLAECKPGERVLDYGGGCGIFSIPLAAKGVAVTYLDLPGPLLDFAAFRFRRRKLPLTVRPAESETPLKDIYDTIVSIFVVEHLVHPESALRHMSEHIKPEGRLLLAVDFEQGRVSNEPLPLHVSRLERDLYYELMAGLGLEIVRSRDDLEVFGFKK
jgi:SAM-dependent methyltransferase